MPNILTDSCSVKDKLASRQSWQTRARRVTSGFINCYNNYSSCNVHAAQRTVNKMRVEKFRDRRRVEARSIFFFLSFFVVFSDTINKCSVFISFHSLYAHLPYRDRTSTTSVSAKSIRSPHPVRTCAAHRFYDPRCSHFRWSSLL